MNNFADTRTTKLESALSANYLLPALLAANTFALLALDQMGSIPGWLKTAAALFLAF
ncbi:MAG: hypothetical protein JOZ54_10030 [Acidobacteria bacterium]|nr:hypothetical protein [Acidobacteriota bacterium]